MNLAQVLAQQGYAGNDPFPSNVRQPQPDELATALAKIGPANMAGNAGAAGDLAYLAGALANKFFTPWAGMPSYEETPGTTDYIGLATGQDIHSPEFMAGSTASFGPPMKAIMAALGAAAPLAAKAEDALANLIVQHNIPQRGVRHAEKMGGLPMPSIGIVKADNPIEGYGDVTLLGDPSMARPSASNLVFSADAYTPRYPAVKTFLSDADQNKLQDFVLEPFGVERGDYTAVRGLPVSVWGVADEVEDSGLDGLRNSAALQARFLWERGELPNNMDRDGMRSYMYDKLRYGSDLQEGYEKWLAELPDRLGLNPDEKLFKGFTNAGNRRYAPHTLDNVIKEMKREIRGADGSTGIYGAGAFRAHLAPKFRNITEVKNARDRIVDKDTMEQFKERSNETLLSLASELKNHTTGLPSNPFSQTDVVIERMLDAAKSPRGWREWFPNAPDELRQQTVEFFDELRNAPTQYFEAKPLRAVDLSEFSAALVPQDADPKVIKHLKDKGVNVETYKDEADRAAKIKARSDLMFSLFAGAVGAGMVMNESEQ